ncbi:hypothetical protein DPMN_118140 [Dreissena polymorpha]|uniref:Uncharacterized protein n=1 Tax=Dreissena polymorpha TaxID=45954 RepID=A0A9D4JQU4_DREPO|nr:hypothetical protein DPMN_118140 [Dreissena polymorpha]
MPDSLPARLGTCRRLPDRKSLRPSVHLQETLSQSATVPRPCLYLQETPRRCQKVSQTVGAPAGASQTVCDGAKTVCSPARHALTVPDRFQTRRGTIRRLPDGSGQSPRPSVYLQETPRQSATVPIPSVHLQETLTRCQSVSQTVSAPAGDSQSVPDSFEDLRGTCVRFPKMRGCEEYLRTCRTFPHGARQSLRPSGLLQDTPRLSSAVPIPSEQLQETRRRCQTVS